MPNGSADRRYRFASRPGFARTAAATVGILLLAAAGLKLYGLGVSPMPRSGWLASPTVQTVVVAWELLLGTWLLSGTVPVYSWLAAVGTFLAFAAVSGYYGIIGQASCGCFGTIQASPWHAFAVDLASLLVLFRARPARGEATFGLRPFASRVVAIGMGSVVLLGLLALVGTLSYGSVDAAFARLRGLPIGAPDYVDFGTVRAGAATEQSVEITNYSDRPIRLIGGTSDCTCVTTSRMPVTIPPGGSVSVEVRLKAPTGGAGSFTRTADLWTDHPDQARFRLTLGCVLNGG